MLSTPVSATVGLVFVVAGMAAVWLMFDASRSAQNYTSRDRIIQAHRIAGYTFVALFCVMTWFMILRLRDMPDDLSMRSMLHILIAIVLAPLLAVKVLIARRYRAFQSALIPLGLTIFTLGFVMVASTAGTYFLRRATVKEISLQSISLGTARIDLRASQELMQKRCSGCHNLDRVVGARKDAGGWLATVNRMRSLPSSNISESDAKIILSYLLSENSIDSSTSQGELTVGKALVDSHCNRCHALDRTYRAVKRPEEWQATVSRMVNYARDTEGFFKPGEEDRIVRFLSLTQTADAVEKRGAGDGSAPKSVPSRAASEPPATTGFSSNSSAYTVGIVSLITGVFGFLTVLRPKAIARSAATGGPTAGSAPLSTAGASPGRKKNFPLELVRLERQTHDCVTLRFRMADADQFRARPGQFLTFHWLLNGQRLVRSYSISSSPSQTGYVEITVKKQPDGRVSPFLNDLVPLGLTVEASGPAGQFFFDEGQHRRIVLFAGGSGITPMASMLRYFDDRCLDVDVTLFYSVRSHNDIIFEEELKRLSARLPHFRFFVIPSRPGANWTGLSGRLDRKMIADNVADLPGSTYFLCGPEPYMAHVKETLQFLNIGSERIKQEKFGGKKMTVDRPHEDAPASGSVEFTKSGLTCGISAGRTLLEVAEMNGVNIPYSCRQGQCGTCITRLSEGEVKMDCEDGLDPALKSQGYILACVAHANDSVRLNA